MIDKRLACCDKCHDPKPDHYRRMSLTANRRWLSKAQRDLILNAQDQRCAYCDQRFGSRVIVNRRERRLNVNWEHCVPYSYSGDSNEENIVAACQICNGWKGSMIFSSFEDIRVYMNSRWEAEHEQRKRRGVIYGESVLEATENA